MIYGAVFRKRDCVLKKFMKITSGKNLPELLKHLRHPNIIEFYGYFLDENEHVNVVLERAITSFDKCYCNYDDSINCSILQNIIRGIRYMHSKDFVHLDIKPENVLIFQTENGFVGKISDFGLTKTGKEGKNNLGSALYIAPECLTQQTYSTKSDIFSFGRTIEVVLGKYSFEKRKAITSKLVIIPPGEEEPTFIVPNILAYRPEKLHPMDRVNKLIDKCCMFKPEERTITYEEIIKELKAIGQLLSVNITDTISFEGYHISKGKCSIEESFQNIIDEFERVEIENKVSNGIFDKEVEFQMKLTTVKKLKDKLKKDKKNASIPKKEIESLEVSIKTMRKTIEEIFKIIEHNKHQENCEMNQNGQKWERSGTQEYEIAKYFYDETDETTIQLKHQLMIKAAKKGHVKAILYVVVNIYRSFAFF